MKNMTWNETVKTEKVSLTQGDVIYTLLKEDGRERGVFDSAADFIYSLSVKRAGEVCYMPDIARNTKRAEDIFDIFVRNCVLPECAMETMAEVLATDEK